MRLYVVQSRTSSEKYLLQFTKFLGVIHVRGSSFLMGGSDYINYALKQESCHYLNLPKFWVVLTKDNSFVIPYPVYCLAGTRILEVLGLFLLYPWTPDSSVFPFEKLNLGRFSQYISPGKIPNLHVRTWDSLPAYRELETTAYLLFPESWLTLFCFLTTSFHFSVCNWRCETLGPGKITHRDDYFSLNSQDSETLASKLAS